jgi:hypothetical protein
MQLECRNQSPVKLPFSAMIAGNEPLVMQAFASFSLIIRNYTGGEQSCFSIFLNMETCIL